MSVPMLRVADLKLSRDQRVKFNKYLRQHFKLGLMNYRTDQTTLSSSCINITVSVFKPYMSNFSHDYLIRFPYNSRS